MKYLLFFLLPFLLPHCAESWEEKDCSVSFINDCNETIYYSWSLSEIDTMFLTPKIVFDSDNDTIELLSLKPGEEFKKDFFHEYPPMENVRTFLHMIIFKQSTFDNYTKEEIVNKNIYDYRMCHWIYALDDYTPIHYNGTQLE